MNIIFVHFSSFRIPVNEQMSTQVIRSERDAWVKVINKLCMDWKQKTQSEHVYEELHGSAKIAESIEEIQSESEQEPETDRVQNNHGSVLVLPTPRPRVFAANVAVPLSEPVLEPVCFPALAPEQVPELKLPSTPVKTPELVPQLATVKSPVSTSALAPALPMPPPLPQKSKPKTLTGRTKAFHWDVIMQDKVLYLQLKACSNKLL